MATITERILNSSGLEANVAQIAAREYGSTLDTERPVMGTTGGGAKFIATEEINVITTAAPAPLPIIKRSRSLVFVNMNTAGASVALDIQAGAQSAGYSLKVFASGPDTRQTIVTYGIGLIEYIPAGMSQEFVWDGTAWNKTLMSWADRYNVGSLIESAIDDTATAKNPIVKLWDADHVLAQANYPLLFAKLYAVKSQSWSGSVYVTDHAVTVAGTLVTGSGTAWDAQLAAIVEDAIVQGGYSAYRGVDIAGTTYAIASVDTLNHRLTVVNLPPAGAQTCIFYANRIAGSTTTVRIYKDSGRATMSPDGTLRINGMRRRFHMQGHWHALTWPGAGSGGGAQANPAFSPYDTTPYTSVGSNATTIKTDGNNGTPIIGPETESNSTTVFRAMWAGVLL
jgi:hypothetical protein